MTWITAFLAGLVLAALAGLLWVRLAPDDPARWHVDPRGVAVTTLGGWKVGGDDAVYPVPAAELLAAIDRVALATPRTIRLAGSPGEGRITYVTRSRLVGFPDYTTVEAAPAGGGAALIAVARQRYGTGDMGVNRARLEAWLARLPDAIDESIDAGPGL